MKRYVLYKKGYGIFLGECMGFGFWSELDPCGQPEAITFENPEQVVEYIAIWNDPIKDYKIVDVESDGRWATIEDCVKAGLPAWIPE